MALLSEHEIKEMLRLAGSSSLRKDAKYLTAHRHNPVVIGDEIDMDRLLDFLTEYNEFVNHTPKPFKPMIDRDMKL